MKFTDIDGDELSIETTPTTVALRITDRQQGTLLRARRINLFPKQVSEVQFGLGAVTEPWRAT